MPDKKEDTYKQLFEIIKELNPRDIPDTMMIDYDKAAINAVQSEFPNISISRCFF